LGRPGNHHETLFKRGRTSIVAFGEKWDVQDRGEMAGGSQARGGRKALVFLGFKSTINRKGAM